jgi:tRNA(adenine34) deaminase
MGEALRLARMAYEAGEVPVGAVIVRDARIIARAYNQVELLKDATAHAEILAITQAANALGDWRLERTARSSSPRNPVPCARAPSCSHG